MGKTLFDKIWDSHVVKSIENGPDILYIDRHYIHEVTSPQAFNGLNERGIKVFRPNKVVATVDHNVPTKDQHLPIVEPQSRKQVSALEVNCEEHNINLYKLLDPHQGIVHVVGPELGHTLPGMTIVCGDSHTSTHGALGTIAFGIGTSEVEMAMATQCIIQNKPNTLNISVSGQLKDGVSAKDLALFIVSKVTPSGGTGYFIEFSGEAIENLSIEGRMTLCNMSIEMGARGGIVAPDQTTIDYVTTKKFFPTEKKEELLTYWSDLKSDPDCQFSKVIEIDASEIEPQITFGTNPGTAINVTGIIPENTNENKSLIYMEFEKGQTLNNHSVDYVFIGSCTNARIEDLREAAQIIQGRKKADNITAYVVPGSKMVEKQAIEEGLDKIFNQAGIELRQPGCSACLAMNEDKIPSGALCVSTSNRNFEGRQGPGSKTILASPATAAAAIVTGKIIDHRELERLDVCLTNKEAVEI